MPIRRGHLRSSTALSFNLRKPFDRAILQEVFNIAILTKGSYFRDVLYVRRREGSGKISLKVNRPSDGKINSQL